MIIPFEVVRQRILLDFIIIPFEVDGTLIMGSLVLQAFIRVRLS